MKKKYRHDDIPRVHFVFLFSFSVALDMGSK